MKAPHQEKTVKTGSPRSSPQQQHGRADRQSESFADNRSQAHLQAAVQQMADSSSQANEITEVQAMADAARPNRTGLPDNLKAGIENLSGYSLDDVRVHYNSDKPATLQAHAYAQGTDIHLASGQEKHLPHEAWHVVQQKQGRVRPTMQLKGNVKINDDAGLEKEADTMGYKAIQMKVDVTDRIGIISREEGHIVQLAKSEDNIFRIKEIISKKGGDEMSEAFSAFLESINVENENIVQGKFIGSGVVQLYGDASYVPDLTGLSVPVHHTDGAPFDYSRPAGWYDNTFKVLLRRQKTRIRDNELEVFCPLISRFRPANTMQIGHIQNWLDYVRSTSPQSRREGINAYNDLNNLRLEDSTANQSHDFEDLWELNDETYDYSDPWIVNDGEMDERTRAELDVQLARLRQPRLVVGRNGEIRGRNIMGEIGEYLHSPILKLFGGALLALFIAYIVSNYLPKS